MAATDIHPHDFSFDKDGRFIFAHVYTLGAARQLDRYLETYNNHDKGNGLGIKGMFDIMHEVSCLVEDLDSLTGYMESGKFVHPSHKLWKQLRHHIRHDLRDTMPSDAQKGMTKTRAKYLGFEAGLFSSMTYERDRFLIGGHTIIIKDIADYLSWANDILDEYIAWSRTTGHLH